MYDKLAGMTGTAKTEEEEFHKIYNLDVVAIPTYRPIIRDDMADLVYKHGEGQVSRRWSTRSRSAQEGSSRCWSARSPSRPREMLSANCSSARACRTRCSTPRSTSERPAIIAQAGRPGAVTIATNMAGRGVDILLGGNPEGLAREQLRNEGVDLAALGEDDPVWQAALAAGEGGGRSRPPEGARGSAACTSSAPNATRPGASTTSCAAVPAARATPARRASTCPWTTT